MRIFSKGIKFRFQIYGRLFWQDIENPYAGCAEEKA
jgi:hypothetical protein